MSEKTKTKTPAPTPVENAPKEDAKAASPETIDVTVRGVPLTISADALDDFELLDDLNELEQNNNPGRLPSLLRRLVGDQWKAVMEALRGDNGRVSVEDGAEFVGEVLEAISPNS